MAAPKGNQFARKANDWADQLRRALSLYEKDGVPKGLALARIAEKVVEKAVGGEWAAIDEIANRLDGKPKQSIDVTQDTTIHHAEDLSDRELESIAAGSRARAVAKKASKKKSTAVH